MTTEGKVRSQDKSYASDIWKPGELLDIVRFECQSSDCGFIRDLPTKNACSQEQTPPCPRCKGRLARTRIADKNDRPAFSNANPPKELMMEPLDAINPERQIQSTKPDSRSQVALVLEDLPIAVQPVEIDARVEIIDDSSIDIQEGPSLLSPLRRKRLSVSNGIIKFFKPHGFPFFWLKDEERMPFGKVSDVKHYRGLIFDSISIVATDSGIHFDLRRLWKSRAATFMKALEDRLQKSRSS